MVQEPPNTLNGDTAHCEAYAAIARLSQRLNGVLKGKPGVVESVIICMLARGHLLLEDRPGLGKTTLAKGLAAGVGGCYARIQCTPDLLPGDITGFSLFNQQEQQFEFRPGPVFSDVLLADEINRATPRTQSALLEAMAERQVTVDAIRHELSPNFFVIATQNPIDQHGTYPLPEAQLDRFAMKLSVGYPDRLDELHMLAEAVGAPLTTGTDACPCFSPGQVSTIQAMVADVFVDAKIQHYLLDLVQSTRSHPAIVLGASPRASLTWQRVAQARAFFHGRQYVVPDDVQETAVPVLGVRLGVLNGTSEQIIQELVGQTPLPAYSSRA
jgi:MoxR-like ATPase